MVALFQEVVVGTWIAGGPVMIALAILALLIYSSILQTLFYLLRLKELSRNENEWGHWVDKPGDSKGIIGQMIHYTQDELTGLDDLHTRFRILRTKLLNPLDRQIRFSSTIVAASPLLGLLGTVMGMFTTFLGLSVSFGGNSLDLVAGGISEALITTQTGLVLAIPGMFMIALVKVQRRGLEHFLSCLQRLSLSRYHRLHTVTD